MRWPRLTRRPPGHWLWLAFVLAVLLTMLLAYGLLAQRAGRSSTDPGVAVGPLGQSPPILTASGDSLRSPERPPGRRIALTFDDGPDPRFTPQIISVLKRYQVPATFFVIGRQAARYPDLVRDEHRKGFELGNHTFSHTDLSALPEDKRLRELDLTEDSIAGISGLRTRLVRPPYSSTADTISLAEQRALVPLARRGYLITVADFDTEDWRQPGIARIVDAATPRDEDGGIVLMHDGGGDRGQTVAALERLIPRLRVQGFSFVNVSELAGLSRQAVELPAPPDQDEDGWLFVSSLGLARGATLTVTYMALAVAVLILGRALFLCTSAALQRRRAQTRVFDPSFTPPVTVVVPAHNEAKVIERAVKSLALSEYPRVEVVIIDDGSTDGTADLVEALDLDNARVIRQNQAGKAGALNRGVSEAATDLVVMVDADTVFEPQTMHMLVQPLKDPRVGAVSGNTKVGNRERLLGRFQHIEYVMGFNLDRRACDYWRCIGCVPGAIGAFRKAAVSDAGGLSAQTLAEDTDLTLAIGRVGWETVYVDDARAWTEVPTGLGGLWRQRYRWSFGTMQALWKHKAALWRRGEGRIGRRAIPYLAVYHVLLPLTGPVIDLLAIYGGAFWDLVPALCVYAIFNALLLLQGIYALYLDRERLGAAWVLPLQQLFYRQLTYLVLFESVRSALFGLRLHWQRLNRTGRINDLPATAARSWRS